MYLGVKYKRVRYNNNKQANKNNTPVLAWQSSVIITHIIVYDMHNKKKHFATMRSSHLIGLFKHHT